MKTRFQRVLISGLSVAVCGLALADAPTAKPATPTPWKITGELEEACSCHVPCPCWFAKLPSRMKCSGSQVVFIQRGQYGDVKLDGLAVAQFVQSPEGETMKDSFGRWNFDYVYVDAKADAAQRQALQEITAHLFPPAAKAREFRFAAITRTVDGQEHRITVGTVATLSGHLIEGGLGGPPKIVNPPLADPTHRQFEQGETTKLSYTDAGQSWNFARSNYMFNRFEVDRTQYELHEAEIARKMAAPPMSSSPAK